MNTLVFGCGGQLGRDLMQVFKTGGKVTGGDLPEVDITDMAAVRRITAEVRPELVINAAAYTDVEGAEDDEASAFLANETGARNVAEAASEAGAPVVYYSTDFVFDGTKTRPYLPEDPVNPLSVYGRSKAAGEEATRMACARHYILRTAWLYGPGGRNFVEKILRAAASRPSLRVVSDEVGSPTHTWDLALMTRAVTATGVHGTYHAVNSGGCSRYEFAREILALAGCDTPVEPCAATEFPVKAVRPAYAVLSTEKLESVGCPVRSWKDALRHYVERRASA